VTIPPERREELRRLADEATPGPWPLFSGGEYVGGVGILVAPDDGGVSPANAAFIAASRQAIPDLLDENDALRAELRTAKDHLRQAMIEMQGSEQWAERIEHRAIRAEARADIRGRAVAIYQDRARQAEARVKAVEDMCDAEEDPDQWPPRPVMHGGEPFPASLMVDAIRRALEE